MVELNPYPSTATCGWRKSYTVTRISEGGSGKNVPRAERTLGDKQYYSCYHVQTCQNCGKVVDRWGYSTGKFDCPDFKPRE